MRENISGGENIPQVTEKENRGDGKSREEDNHQGKNNASAHHRVENNKSSV